MKGLSITLIFGSRLLLMRPEVLADETGLEELGRGEQGRNYVRKSREERCYYNSVL